MANNDCSMFPAIDFSRGFVIDLGNDAYPSNGWIARMNSFLYGP